MSSHYDSSKRRLVTNQLTSGQNLPLPCVDTFGVQYSVVNAIATVAYGESIRIGEAAHHLHWFHVANSSNLVKFKVETQTPTVSVHCEELYMLLNCNKLITRFGEGNYVPI